MDERDLTNLTVIKNSKFGEKISNGFQKFDFFENLLKNSDKFYPLKF